MVKVVTVLGARPQFIKAGSVSRQFERYGVEEVIVHTGQHYDQNMSDVFFTQMQIPKPKYNLGIGGRSHGAMTGQMIEEIEVILLKEKPDWVLVYGDTNSTLAAAIAASKLRIKIAHVEAGLRSFNMNMPEEINRILTDRISHVLFCPTKTSVLNLEAEGVSDWGADVQLVGDVMHDGALFYKTSSEPVEGVSGSYILATVHRAENTDSPERLTNIVEAVNELANEHQIVFPIHPRTRGKLAELSLALSDSVNVIDPVGYLEMVWLIDNARLVLTDSGGLQKEAFFFGKPCITLRNETEWVELVEHDVNTLVGADRNKIVSAVNKNAFSGDFTLPLYGDGSASIKIAEYIASR